MKAIAYVSNSFPEASETYVWAEIHALRNRGQNVIACSFRRPHQPPPEATSFAAEAHYVLPLSLQNVLLASLLLLRGFHRIGDLVWRALRGPEPLPKKIRALAHTFLGVCLAAGLRRGNVGHVHVHHGYFASWAGLVCARLLGCTYSLTLHGSDLLVRRDYLDCKLQNATFCVTISQFNRDSILGRYPAIQASKIRIHRLGVDSEFWHPLAGSANSKFTMVSVGRLHAVKNYGFLIRACHILKLSGLPVRCVIAGDGEERQCLEQLVVGMELQHEVEFLGRVPRGHLPELYAQADVVVFTSLSEGVPLAAIEAMAMGRLVLAPAITGFPELITDGKTGLLYRAQSMAHFIAKLEEIRSNTERNRSIGRAARAQVREKFDQAHHLELFTTDFLQLVGSAGKECPLASANPVLQQI